MSLGGIVFVVAVAISATGAFFNDTETSTGNTFTAGALDLKVDSTAHYNGMICTPGEVGSTWQPDPAIFPNGEPDDHFPQAGMPCNGTFGESDLVAGMPEFRFFDLTDVKPGDEGEDTISLHVYDNDAWGCFLVDNVVDSDVDCTEPESESSDPECSAEVPPAPAPGDGELATALTFNAWLDQGTIPGFQNVGPDGVAIDADEITPGVQAPDPAEGNNIQDETPLETLFWTGETIDEVSEGPFDLRDVLGGAFAAFCSVDGDPTGANGYGPCQGLAADGRMVGSTTYYFGLGWNVPDTAGNEIQTDSLVTDMTFQVEQHRNNPDFTCAGRVVETDATTLTVTKIVTNNNGGDAIVTDFTLTISGVGNVVSGVANDVAPGDYDVSELGVGGYNATFTGDCDADGNVTVADGDELTCTITNDDIGPTVTLTKVVSGGTAVPTDFTMRVNGTAVPTGNSIGVDANADITITEDPEAGYTGVITGTGCPATLGELFQMDLAESISCTITNTFAS